MWISKPEPHELKLCHKFNVEIHQRSIHRYLLCNYKPIHSDTIGNMYYSNVVNRHNAFAFLPTLMLKDWGRLSFVSTAYPMFQTCQLTQEYLVHIHSYLKQLKLIFRCFSGTDWAYVIWQMSNGRRGTIWHENVKTSCTHYKGWWYSSRFLCVCFGLKEPGSN